MCVPLSLLAASGWWAWKTEQIQARERLTHNLSLHHDNLLRAFETQEAILAALQLHTAALSWTQIAESEDVAAFMRGLDRHARDRRTLSMISPEARVVQSSASPIFPLPLLELPGLDYVQAQRGPRPGPFISNVAMGEAAGGAGLTYSRPRLDQSGQPDGGTLVVTFPVAPLERFLELAVETPNDVAAIVRLDGFMLARHPPAPLSATRLPLIGPGTAAVAAAEAAGGIGFATGTSGVDHQSRLYGARVLAPYPVAIVYGMHPEGPRQAWLQQFYALLALALATILLLLGLTWLAQRQTWAMADALRRERDAQERARQQAEARADAEVALRRGQRLAVLGQTVAGVAHDFRNTVQAVQAGVVLLEKALDRADAARARSLATMIGEAAHRSQALTQRMLRSIPARGAVVHDQGTPTLDPVESISAAVGLIRRALHPRHEVVLSIPEDPPLPARVRGDPAELEAALLNFAVNARDAMQDGGRIDITAVRDRVAGDHPAGLRPGVHVRISVADNGTGMDAETLAQAAQAFFTTKDPGLGTGLGLATAETFVRKAGGALRITSPGPGCGTTVTIWLPEASAAAVPGG